MISDAMSAVAAALRRADAEKSTARAIDGLKLGSDITVIAVGKAASAMTRAAAERLGGRIKRGYVLTKYCHGEKFDRRFRVSEGAHPVPDKNCVRHTCDIIRLVRSLGSDDEVLMLISGGASALFTAPLIKLEECCKITNALMRAGADISELNAVRKRLCAVKGGRFALMCKCKITCVILSDVLGDRLDDIASGPCVRDMSDDTAALEAFTKYLGSSELDSERIRRLLVAEREIQIPSVQCVIAGNADSLREGAKEELERLGYEAVASKAYLTGEARVRAREIAARAKRLRHTESGKIALIYTGETTVTVTGSGAGGRNQEAALAAAAELRGEEGVLFLSIGSDGTDGPTDAAGGFADGSSYNKMLAESISPEEYLNDNNSYAALGAIDSLIFTGPTGTNVGDLTLALVDCEKIQS